MQRGFTLLEMIVVMVLIGLATTLAVPAMQRWNDAVQARTRAAQIIDALRAAMFDAAAKRRDTIIDDASFTPEGDPQPVKSPLSQPGPGRLEQAMAEDVVAPLKLQLPDGWKPERVDRIRFHANGLCTAGSLWFRTDRDQVLRIEIGGPICSVETVEVAAARSP